MQRIKVAKSSEIVSGSAKQVKVGEELVAVWKTENGEVFATGDICSHEYCNLSDGGKIEGGVIECPCHGARYDVKTGAVVLPPAVEPIKTYKASIEGEDVVLEHE